MTRTARQTWLRGRRRTLGVRIRALRSHLAGYDRHDLFFAGGVTAALTGGFRLHVSITLIVAGLAFATIGYRRGL